MLNTDSLISSILDDGKGTDATARSWSGINKDSVKTIPRENIVEIQYSLIPPKTFVDETGFSVFWEF